MSLIYERKFKGIYFCNEDCKNIVLRIYVLHGLIRLEVA